MREVLYWVGNAIDLYTLVLFARMIMGFVLSFTQYRPTGGAAVAFEVVYTVTDPPLKFLRRFIPMLRVGNFAIDLSFIVLVIGLGIIADQLKSA